MALTKKQIEGVINLFVSSYVNSNTEADRKKELIEFEDAFGRSIGEWKSICREKIEQRVCDPSVISFFDEFVNRKNQTDIADEYEVRLLEESDLEQTRALINSTFGIGLTYYDDDKLKTFIDGGYSVVACNGEEIVGVALAFEMPDYNITTIYLDTFAVAEQFRGDGIGKKMIRHIQKIGRADGRIGKIKLQTDRKIDAYYIYKHWGFQEDELIHMHSYFF